MIKKKLLYSEFIVSGNNAEGFINSLKRAGVDVYRVEKRGKKEMTVTVSRADEKKFFAKTEDMCYNVKKCADKGFLAPFLYLVDNWGILIGAVIFLIAAFISGNVLLGFTFKGSGSIYEEEIAAYLADIGIVRYSFFSSVNEEEVANGLMADFDFSFASVKKRGNYLVIETVLSKEVKSAVDSDKKAILSPWEGVVEEIKVYRGTAAVEEGDAVNEGDLLVDGYKIIKETRVDTYVLAEIKIRRNYYFEYRSVKGGEEDLALALAEEAFSGETVSEKVSVTEDEKGFLYSVVLEYISVIT